MTRDELKVWLDRTPPRPHDNDCVWRIHEKCDCPTGGAWMEWFEFHAISNDPEIPLVSQYLGEGSARTGPDPIQTDQKCDCKQCKGAHNEG